MKLNTYNKKRITDYFLVILIVLFSSRSNIFFLDPRYLVLPVAFTLFIFHNRRLKTKKNTMVIYLVYFLLIFAYFIKYHGEFDPMFTYIYFIYLTFAIFVLSIVKYNFFRFYMNILYFFALISLPLFAFRTFFFYSTLKVFRFIQGILQIPFYENMTEYSNIIIYTVRWKQWRNCGFTWEPGPFAAYLVLAIIINLSLNNFNIKNKKLLVLLAALITTFSTTGYLALSLILIWYIYNKSIKKKIILLPIFFIIIIYLFSLPFMSEKIVNLSKSPKYLLEQRIEKSRNLNKSLTLGRFAGFLMNWETFKEHPVIGYGGHSEETFYAKLNIRLASVNGIGNWMAKFGLFGILIMIYTYYKSIDNITIYFNFKYKIFIYAILFVLFFSFNLNRLPLFFAFQFSYFILPKLKLSDVNHNE